MRVVATVQLSAQGQPRLFRYLPTEEEVLFAPGDESLSPAACNRLSRPFAGAGHPRS
jgi:hypothetical protein